MVIRQNHFQAKGAVNRAIQRMKRDKASMIISIEGLSTDSVKLTHTEREAPMEDCQSTKKDLQFWLSRLVQQLFLLLFMVQTHRCFLTLRYERDMEPRRLESQN